MPTVGQKLIAMRTVHLARFAEAQMAVSETEKVFEAAYQAYVISDQQERYKRLSGDRAAGVVMTDNEKTELAALKHFLAKPEVGSVDGAVAHVFDIAFATLGRDCVVLPVEQLSLPQKIWLAERYADLKADLLMMHQRVTLLALKKIGYSLPELRLGIADETVQQEITAELNALENAENDGNNNAAKTILTQLKITWVQAAAAIDNDIAELRLPLSYSASPVQQAAHYSLDPAVKPRDDVGRGYSLGDRHPLVIAQTEYKQQNAGYNSDDVRYQKQSAGYNSDDVRYKQQSAGYNPDDVRYPQDRAPQSVAVVIDEAPIVSNSRTPVFYRTL